MGDVNSFHEDGCNITFNCENGRVRLSFLKDDLIRVHIAPAGKDFSKDDLHLDENGPYAVVTYTWPGVSYKVSEGFDYDLEGFVYTIRAGAIIPMMPETSYIYQKPPEPITLDIYPDAEAASKYVMYDCQVPKKSPITETTFGCLEDRAKIEISTGPSNSAYELWVHCGREPVSVYADSEKLPKQDKAGYAAGEKGWYYGPGCFYGSDTLKTLSIKIPKVGRSRLVRIEK